MAASRVVSVFVRIALDARVGVENLPRIFPCYTRPDLKTKFCDRGVGPCAIVDKVRISRATTLSSSGACRKEGVICIAEGPRRVESSQCSLKSCDLVDVRRFSGWHPGNAMLLLPGHWLSSRVSTMTQYFTFDCRRPNYCRYVHGNSNHLSFAWTHSSLESNTVGVTHLPPVWPFCRQDNGQSYST